MLVVRGGSDNKPTERTKAVATVTAKAAAVKPKTTEVQQSGSNKMDAIYQIAATGNMSKLSDQEKLDYLGYVCKANGLNPTTRPIQLLTFQGKTVLYATKQCSAQLTRLHKLTVKLVSMVRMEKEAILMCTVEISDPSGRIGFGIGCVPFGSTLKAELAANAYMKAHTKAIRRGVLDFCGLGFLDETEFDTMGNIKKDPLTEKEGKKKSKELAAVDKVVEPESIEVEVVEPAKKQRSVLSPPEGKEKKLEVKNSEESKVSSDIHKVSVSEHSENKGEFLYEEKAHRQALIKHIRGRFPEIKRNELSRLGTKYQFSKLWSEVLDDLNAMKAEGKISYDD